MSFPDVFDVLTKIEAMPEAMHDRANIMISFLGLKDWHDVHQLEEMLGIEFETTFASTMLRAADPEKPRFSIYAHTTFDMIADKKQDANILAASVVDELAKRGMSYEQIKAKFTDLVNQ